MRLGLSKLTVSGIIALLGTMAVMVAGCGSTTTGGALPDSQQILNIPLVVTDIDIKTMDPAHDQDYYSYFPIFMTFPNLLTLDNSGNVIPWAATAMPSFNASTNTYTFSVKSGMKWSDGTPIDANTFAYSINRSLSPCTASAVSYYLYPIANAAAFNTEKCNTSSGAITGPIQSLIGSSLIVPDAQTLEIKLSAPAPYFLDALTYPTGDAQPEQLIQKYGEVNWTNHLADGTGFGGNLYKVKLWNHTGDLDLVRNTQTTWAQPKLREVDFHIYKTANAEYADYLDGKLDQGAAPPAQYKQSKARTDYHEVPALSIAYYQPNWKVAPFNDPNARLAFSIALDRNVLANNVDEGSVIPTFHIVPQGMPGYCQGCTLNGSTALGGDTAGATALANTYAEKNCKGYVANSNQFQKCPAVTLSDSNDPAIVTFDQAAVQMWQTAFPGWPIKTNFLDFNTLLSQIYSPNVPQIFGIGWIADYPDAEDWLSLQFSAAAINNTGSVDVPAANALMLQADGNLNPTQRIQQYNQAEQLLINQGAWISLDQGKTFYNLNPIVKNFSFTTLGTISLATWQQIYLT